ncbi:PucR family transcriptional regulator [Clostridium sp. Marseille-QA1073]
MTVFELLNLTKLKVINTKADLYREVETIESTETPDVATYLPQNTLLITTAMVYKDNQDQLCELIYKLNDLPCAALAIKLGRFIDELDKKVIMTADKLGFPLLQIPMELTLGEVYQQVLSYLWNVQNKEILHALNTQKKFSNLLFQGESAEMLLNNLSNILKKSVLLIDPLGNVIGTNCNFKEENIETAKELFFSLSLYKKKSSTVQHYIDAKNKKERISIYPYHAFDENSCYLFIFDSESLSADISALVIEQVLLAFEFLLYKNLCISYNKLKDDEKLLLSILNKHKNDNLTSQQLLTIGKAHGLKLSKFYYVILVTLESFKNNKFHVNKFSHREQKYIFIYEWLEKELFKEYRNSVILLPEIKNYRYVFLIQGNTNDLTEKLRYYHDKLKSMLQVKVSFSYGNRMSEVEAIKYSYFEALESYKMGEERNNISYIKYYKTKNAAELLKTLPRDQIEGFCLYNLRTLAYPENMRTLELRNTLKTYLELKCNITETSNKMFIHRNTVKYRIKKCEDILERKIDDSDFIFQLQLSLILTEDK